MTYDEHVKACLAVEYPRLDIRCGGTYARPWEFRRPMVIGWIDDHGVIHEFAR